MALFKGLGGKTAADHEKRADELFAEQAWGKAKLEYEKALDKLESVADPETAVVKHLKEQVRRSCQALAEEHIESGRDLMKSGFPEDAAGMFDLALELCEDDQTRARITDLLEKCRPAAEWGPVKPAESGEPDTESFLPPDLAEDHFAVLCGMLPDELQDIYAGYGPAFQKGYVALHEGRFDQAAELLEAAQQETPDDSGYISLELAGAYFNLGRLDEARGLLETFIEHHPEALPGYEMLSEIYWEQKDFENARRLLKNCPQPLQSSAAFVVLYGETLRRQAQYEEATRWLTDHLQAHGWNDKIAITLASVYEQSEKRDEALAIYASYMNNCRGCGAQTPLEVERKYADLSLAGGNHSDQILEIYLALARKDPANAVDYYLNASRIYAARDNQSEATRFKDIADQLLADRQT